MTPPSSPHLPLAVLTTLVLNDEGHPHLAQCTFCREQFEFLRTLEEEIPEHVEEGYDSSFRLAAATAPEPATLALRHTWEMDGGRTLVRVFEDVHRQLLVGSLLVDPPLLNRVLVVFSGLPTGFRPDENGGFDIGPLDLDIESMSVSLADLPT